MKFAQLFSIIFFLISASTNAQMTLSISRKDFRTEKPGFTDAWKHIKQGNSYYKRGGVWYSNAQSEYQQAYAYNSDNAELNYKLGVSCLFSDKKDEASGFFIKAYELKKDVTPDILLLTGRALMYNGKFSEAIRKLSSYLSSPEKKPKDYFALANKCMEECKAAIVLTKDTLRVDIKNIGGNINSGADDYSEVLTANRHKMLFASRRALTATANNYYYDTKLDENIFSSDLVNGAWTVAMLPDKNLVTKYCEAPLYINEAGNELYIYAGYQGSGDIMVSESKKGKWKTPVPVSFKINSSSPETSLTFSPKGDEIAFVSDRGKKGMGGKDIYTMKRIGKKKWTHPLNAGQAINTQYDEESVRFSRGGDTLWFSSKGHNSIGGYDIFYSTRTSETGAWSQAVNAGYPINTPWDELFYFPVADNDSSFFFASDRSGGFGGLDIYRGRFLPPPPPKPVEIPVPLLPEKHDTVIVVKEVIKEAPVPVPVPVITPAPKELVLFLAGKVTDSETKEPVMARIEIFDMSTDQVIETTASSDADGSFKVKLPAKKSYMVNLRAAGFLSDMKRVIIPDSYTEELYTLDISLIKVKVGKKFVLENILFETGKSVLAVSSYTALDKILKALQDNPQLKIEISGFTDNTGSAAINVKLSEARARAVVVYLAGKGIDISRLSFHGYGSEQPIADNATADGRAKNRRVELKIIGL
jgi:outer membrane protein OmpA-like peptidoglycan-associated protein